MTTEVRVGLIAGSAQVVAALIALVGVLFAASSPAKATQASPGNVLNSEIPCPDVIEAYRRMILLDPRLVDALSTTGANGVSPIEADFDARRCGLSTESLEEMMTGDEASAGP